MHQDQMRVASKLLPVFASVTLENDARSLQDCTVLNRLFLQGPDPLFIALTCPHDFLELCAQLKISNQDGLAAIQRAHVQGPGCLLVGQGFQPNNLGTPTPREHLLEVLWLVLACCSACAEEGYSESISLTDRIEFAMGVAVRFHEAVQEIAPFDLAELALTGFQRATMFTPGLHGIPTTDRDEGFYLAYKAGHKVAAVKPPGGKLTFYGTTPDTTLEEQGVTVDKPLSASFGIIFDRE